MKKERKISQYIQTVVGIVTNHIPWMLSHYQ